MVAEKQRSLLWCLGVIALVGATSASAAPLCVNGSLSTYSPATSVSSAISCQYQDLIFTFSFGELVYQRDPSQPALLPGDRIENHVDIAFINPSLGVEGILLTPTDYLWFGKDGNSADVNFTYDVTVATAGLYMTGAAFDLHATMNLNGGA